MALASATRRLFNVQPGEGRPAALMLAHSFSMGLSTVFFETAASALFLSRFGAATLPWVYVAAAVVNTVTGVAYSAIQPRVGFPRLMSGTLSFLLVSTLAFRAGLAVSDAAWLLFGLLVWYRVISILTDLEYWAVAARLYDVRQAKRLFGFIGSGEVVARILGAFSVPLILAHTPVANLLVLSAAGLLGCTIVLHLVLRGAPPEAVQAPAGPERGKSAAKPDAADGAARATLLKRVLADRYLMLIVALAFFSVLGKYFVDFAFLGQMKARFEDTKGLATFFGVFSGVSQTLSLVTRVAISGRLLNRFGIRVGVMVLPAVHLLCTIGIVGLGLFESMGKAVFWLVIANQGVYKTLKHPIDNPSFKILYQPLKKAERLATQIAVETIVNPVGLGLAGGVMLLFSAVIPYDPVKFSYALLATFVGWLYVARRTGREYGHALVRALKGRIEDIPFVFDDEQSLEVIEKTLAKGDPAHVLFALDLLERGEPERVGPRLLGLLSHPEPEVRGSVLERVERIAPPGSLDAVRGRLQVEKSPRVRAAALRCLAALGGDDVEGEVAAFLDDPDAEVRRGAMIGLLRQGAPFALEHLEQRVTDPVAAVRAWAATVIGEVGLAQLHEPLGRLLADRDPGVRRNALVAAGRLSDPRLWPAVLEALADRSLCGPAAAALVSGGPTALEAVHAGLTDDTPLPVAIRLVRVLGRARGERAIAMLRERLAHRHASVRHEVLLALRACGYRASEAEEPEIERRLRFELEAAAWTLAALRDIADAPALELLRGALGAEVNRARERVFLLLSFVYDRDAILRARDHRSDASREKRAYALEILDVTLEGDLKPMLLPFLDDLPQKLVRLDPYFPQPSLAANTRLREILERGERWLTPWTQACALHAAAAAAAIDVTSSVETILRSGSTQLIRETGRYTLSKLKAAATGDDEARRQGRGAMHTIEKVITLKGIPMFASSSEDVLADIAAVLEEVEYAAGDRIFDKGEVGDSLYIILEGRVRVFDSDRTIVHLGERDIFGELALLDPEPRFASIEAEEPTRLLRLDRDAFLELMAGNIEIVRGVMHVLCERLRRTVQETGPYVDKHQASVDTGGEVA